MIVEPGAQRRNVFSAMAAISPVPNTLSFLTSKLDRWSIRLRHWMIVASCSRKGSGPLPAEREGLAVMARRVGALPTRPGDLFGSCCITLSGMTLLRIVVRSSLLFEHGLFEKPAFHLSGSCSDAEITHQL
jgi:hypothetical protein